MKQTSKIPYIVGFAMCFAAMVVLIATSPMPAWMNWIEARLGVLVGAIIAGYCSFNFTTLPVKIDGKFNKSLLWWVLCWIIVAQIFISFYIADK